jgi:hypothetical protein
MASPYEITEEEYISHFTAKPIKRYPKKIKIKKEFYNVIIKEYEYESKIFLRGEVWDDAMDKLYTMITLIKTPRARYHSPLNSWFDIEPKIIGTNEGRVMVKEMIKCIIKRKVAFIIEDIFPEDIMYNALNKTYDEEKYNKVKEFYEGVGLEFKFNPENGKGFLIYKDKKMNEVESKLFEKFISK